MSEVVLSVLEEIDPRVAWPLEAPNFTPWLSENLKILGAAIGLQMELVQAEMPVGRFAADILARNSLDGSLVLIENQLETGDHGHLGQILTYLTGLKAETVVWVAPNFQVEHLSAIRWLNDNTMQPFSFFAVKLKLLRIGESYAPHFEVVESPNDWDREIEQVAQSATALRRRRFWDRYKAMFPDTVSDRPAGGGASLWHNVPGTDLVISQWLSQKGVGLFVRGPFGDPVSSVVEHLRPFQNQLEQALEAKLDFPKFPLLLRKSGDGDVETDEDFTEQATWLHEHLLLYEAELTKVVGVSTSTGAFTA